MPSPKKDDKVCCGTCKRWVTRKGLYRHMIDIHQYTHDQIDCMKKERQEAQPGTLKISCPICGGKFFDHEKLANHCDKEHSRDGANGTVQDYTIYSRRFPTKDEFKKWLQEQCRRTASKLYHRSAKGRWYYMRCNRAGQFISRSTVRSKSSKKDVSHCPCFTNYVVNDDGTVSVKGCFGHAGHGVGPTVPRIKRRRKVHSQSLLEDHFSGSQERLEKRMSLRNNIQLCGSMVSSNISALVNIDTEEAMAKLIEIYELIDKASKIRIDHDAQKPEIMIPKLPRQGPMLLPTKTKYTVGIV